MADRLPLGRIEPAARPVGAFITPAQIEAQAPAKPSRLSASNSGISLQSTAAKPNVPGYNPGEQLAEALQQFAPQLTKALSGGLELYASHEYQAGQNEVAKAQILAERQVDQSSVEYATANKKLAQRDPYAAMAMDQTNPFRYAGRQMALSQLAAGQVGTALQSAYRKSAGELALLDPADPAINEVKANAVNSIVQQFQLDPNKAGFAQHFLPALNRGWERVTAQHIEDRNNYLKDTVWRIAGVGVAQIYRSFKRDGKSLSQAAQLAGELLDQEAVRLGQPGEATAMKQRAITAAREILIAEGLGDVANSMIEIPVMPPDGEGYRPTAGQVHRLELMEDADKYGEIRRRAKDRDLQPVRDALTAEVGAIGLGMDDGPEKGEALQGLLKDERFAALGLGEKLDIIGKGNKLGEEVRGQAFNPEAAGTFIASLDQKYGFGSKRDFAAAEADLAEVLEQTPQEDRARLRQQYVDWKNKQQKQPWDLINPAIANKIKANLAEKYPDLDVAALRGLNNIESVLQWGDQKSKESAALQLAGYRSFILQRLDEKRTQWGRELTDTEALQVIRDSIFLFPKDQKEQYNQMFPQLPSGGGGQAAKPTPPPGTRPSTAPRASSAQTLDSIPDRQTALQNWNSQPLLTPQATQGLVSDALNGKALPNSFIRAAKDAGTTPEQLLIRQVGFYQNEIKLSPQQRDQILKRGNQARALNNSRQTQNSIDVAALVRDASGWMTNSLLGITPASARTSDADLIRRYSDGGSYGSSSWTSGPAVQTSHPDSGTGWTVPGLKDAHGRPPVFSRGGANAFAAMVRDSGGQVKASDIASSQRSRQKNAAVGGVAGSEHLGGNAMDIHGTSEAWIRKNGAKYGWYVNDYQGSHGGHFEFRGGGSAASASLPPTTRRGGGLTGLATYYTGSGGSDGVAGGPTANGERYNPSAMTAAVQWSLRGKYLNKWVTVEDLDTGRSVRVWVNDVGQMGGSNSSVNKSDPRVIDLSPAAFKRLFGGTQRGVGRIRIVSAS